MPAQQLVSSVEGPQGAPVLVLGNPIGTTRDVWSHQVPVLSRYFQVVRYEPRGHGARLTVIQAASHFAHYEKPGPVTNALLTHFQATLA